MKREFLDDGDGIVSDFCYKCAKSDDHTSAIGSDGQPELTPTSGVYDGWFDIVQEEGPPVKVREKGVKFKFTPNAEGDRYDVAGTGKNSVGYFDLSGSLILDSGILELSKIYRPVKAVPAKTGDRGRNMGENDVAMDNENDVKTRSSDVKLGNAGKGNPVALLVRHSLVADKTLVRAIGDEYSDWACTACTLINPCSASSCEMCTTPRMPLANTKDNNLDMSEAPPFPEREKMAEDKYAGMTKLEKKRLQGKKRKVRTRAFILPCAPPPGPPRQRTVCSCASTKRGCICLCGEWVPVGKSCTSLTKNKEIKSSGRHTFEGKDVKRRIWCEAHARHYNKGNKHSSEHVVGADNICRLKDGFEGGGSKKKKVVTQAEDELFLVEKILKGPRKSDGRWLVKWIGYSSKHNSWEPAENLPAVLIENEVVKKNARVQQQKGATEVFGKNEMPIASHVHSTDLAEENLKTPVPRSSRKRAPPAHFHENPSLERSWESSHGSSLCAQKSEPPSKRIKVSDNPTQHLAQSPADTAQCPPLPPSVQIAAPVEPPRPLPPATTTEATAGPLSSQKGYITTQQIKEAVFFVLGSCSVDDKKNLRKGEMRRRVETRLGAAEGFAKIRKAEIKAFTQDFLHGQIPTSNKTAACDVLVMRGVEGAAVGGAIW
jgi:hypothetical protein